MNKLKLKLLAIIVGCLTCLAIFFNATWRSYASTENLVGEGINPKLLLIILPTITSIMFMVFFRIGAWKKNLNLPTLGSIALGIIWLTFFMLMIHTLMTYGNSLEKQGLKGLSPMLMSMVFVYINIGGAFVAIGFVFGRYFPGWLFDKLKKEPLERSPS